MRFPAHEVRHPAEVEQNRSTGQRLPREPCGKTEAMLAQRYDHPHTQLTADALSPSKSLALVETRAKELTVHE